MHADPDVLAHCVAIILARDERDGTALMRLAERLRFGTIIRHSSAWGPDPFDQRLVFFLVHFDFDMDQRKQLLKERRQAGSVSLCFAPVVLFLRDATRAEVRANIELGFDDVVSVPEDGRVIATRLAAQIGHEQVYIETRNYLGPDRHRMDGPGDVRKPEEEHARLTVLRTPEAGVQIVKRQVVAKGR